MRLQMRSLVLSRGTVKRAKRALLTKHQRRTYASWTVLLVENSRDAFFFQRLGQEFGVFVLADGPKQRYLCFLLQHVISHSYAVEGAASSAVVDILELLNRCEKRPLLFCPDYRVADRQVMLLEEGIIRNLHRNVDQRIVNRDYIVLRLTFHI